MAAAAALGIATGEGPRFAADLVGHAEAEAALLAAWNAGRMPHAWLIGGPPGIGKATLAYRLARFVLKQGQAAGGGAGIFGPPPPPASLGVPASDPVFRRVASGGHADLIVIERGVDEKTGRRRAEILVEDARSLGDALRKTSGEGLWRVAIVDGADEMNPSAANALLKILEEPPAHVLLILVAHRPGRLLPTIRSRCRRLMLQPLAADQVAALAGRLRPDLPAADLPTLVQLAKGSPGRALDLAAVEAVGLYRDLTGLLAGLPRLDPKAVQALGDRMAQARADDGPWRAFRELLALWLARLARRLATGQAESEFVAGEEASLARAAAKGGLERWLEVWDKSARLFERCDAVNLDRKQVVINVFAAIAQAARGGV